MPDSIIFNAINVNGLETNNGIFVGDNAASNWASHNKNQFAIGQVFGAFNNYPANFNTIIDQDFIDTPINDADVQPTAPTQV